MQLLLNQKGLNQYAKLSYPARFGRYHELRLQDCIYHLSLDGFPKFLQGTQETWPHPSEWIKLTRAGDWVYYSAMGYHDLYDLCGEYYYPFLPYGSNPLFDNNPLNSQAVQKLLADHDLRCREAALLAQNGRELTDEERKILLLFSRWDTNQIRRHADGLHRIIKARIPVLPPDCRHVDYDVIPLVVTEGCLANCGFCCIKTSGEFRERSREEVMEQLIGLKGHLGPEMANYAGIFLGQHDALGAGIEPGLNAMEQALDVLQPGRFIKPLTFFLFASVPSLMQLKDHDLTRLAKTQAKVFINVGIESFDQETLNILRKPVSAEENLQAFARILRINRTRGDLNISVNLVSGNSVGAGHIPAIINMLSRINGFDPYTTIYLSPLIGDFNRKKFLAELNLLKSIRKIEIFPYLIQRL